MRRARTRTKRRRAGGLIVVLIAIAAGPGVEGAAAACLPSGQYATPVTVTNPGAALADHIAIVTLDTQTPIAAGHMRSDLGDLRFTRGYPACDELPAWVEKGANTTATKVWLRMPVAAGTSTVYAFYGTPAATKANQVADVFGTGLASLHTFDEGSGGTVSDPVGGFNLSNVGATWTAGPRPQINGITGFTDGNHTTGNRIIATNSGPSLGSGNFSVFALVRPTAADVSKATHAIIGSYSTDGGSGWLLKFQDENVAGRHQLLTTGAGFFCFFAGGNTAAANTWQMVSATRGPAINRTYLGGSLGASNCPNDVRNVDSVVNRFEIGRGYEGDYSLQGVASLAAVYTRELSGTEIAALNGALLPAVTPTNAVGAEAPVGLQLTPPAAVTRGTDAGVCSATFTPPAFTATGMPLPVSVTSDAPPVFPLGLTTVNGTAVNGIDPNATASFGVTVQDLENPAITAPADVTVAATRPDGAEVGFGSFTASDNCPGVTVGTPSQASGSVFGFDTTRVTATATDAAGNTASAGFDVRVLPVVPGPPIVPFVPAPETLGDSGPPSRLLSRTAVFTFHAAVTGATFECRLDNGPFRPCTSGFTLRSLPSGSHTVQVRAVGAGGPDATPHTWRFVVDVRPPAVTLSRGTVTVDRSGRVRLGVRCTPKAGRPPCRVAIVARGQGKNAKTVYARGSASLRGTALTRVRLTLARTAKTLIARARGGRLATVVTVDATDAGGLRTTVRTKRTLVRAPR